VVARDAGAVRRGRAPAAGVAGGGAGRRGRRLAERILPGRRGTAGEPAMKTRLVGIAAALAVLALPSVAQADAITANCTTSAGMGACSTDWYRTSVTVSFVLPAGSSNPQGCGDQTVSPDTAGVTLTGAVVVSGSPQCCVLNVPTKIDATPPTVTASAARAPDSNGWYNHAVGVGFSGTDSLSGVASCTSATYGGPDNGSASVSGTCT